MRFLALYSMVLFSAIFIAGYAASEPNKGVQPGYEVWGTSTGIPEVWFTESDEEEGLMGIITHYNQNTSPNNLGEDTVTLETPMGPITVMVDRTQNIDCMPVKPCPDSLEVYDLPDGMIAIPPSHIIDEDSFGTILIYKYQGM